MIVKLILRLIILNSFIIIQEAVRFPIDSLNAFFIM